MKLKAIFLAISFLCLFCACKSQIYSPNLFRYYGIGTIFYPYVGYYQGWVANGIAHGEGTFYYADGTIFHGIFSNGWRNGPGVVANPYYGYIAGCWTQGIFTGDCQKARSLYDSRQNMRQVISEANNNFSNEADFVSTSPEGYEIERIEPNSQLGQQLLGKYSGK